MVSQLAKFNRIFLLAARSSTGFAMMFLPACGLEQELPSAKGTDCQGPNCFDAGTSEKRPTVVPISPVLDAALQPASSADAESPLSPVCRGNCIVGDPGECSGVRVEPERHRLRGFDRRVLTGNSGDSGVSAEDAGATPMPEGTLDKAGIDTFPDAGVGAEVGYSCQIALQGQDLQASCEPSGEGLVGASCTSSDYCASGLGCVVVGGIGRCLKYCCGGDSDCGDGRFCAEMPPLLPSGGPSSPSASGQKYLVPVCTKAAQCRLGEPSSCPEDAKLSCTVVADDGTTGCVMPGSGKQEDPCPCGAGYFCSRASQTCLKLCTLESPTMCGDLTCQPGPNFPIGWGLCVGLRAADKPAKP